MGGQPSAHLGLLQDRLRPAAKFGGYLDLLPSTANFLTHLRPPLRPAAPPLPHPPPPGHWPGPKPPGLCSVQAHVGTAPNAHNPGLQGEHLLCHISLGA